MTNSIDNSKIVVSNKLSFSIQDFKYFIGSKDNKKIKLLCLFSLEANVYKIDFNGR